MNTYNIQFDLAGGGVRETERVEYGAWKYISAPSRVGYEFTGWKVTGHDVQTAKYSIINGQAVSMDRTPYVVSTNGSVSFYNLATTNEANVTLTAQWIQLQFTISFDSNGGTSVSPIT